MTTSPIICDESLVKPPAGDARAIQPGAWRRLVFGFLCAYLFLYNLPTFLSLVPFLRKGYGQISDAVVPWVGKHVLRLTYEFSVEGNGSGDTTAAYIETLCLAVLAAVIALVWWVAGLRRKAWPRVEAGLRVLVRYALGFALVSYGMYKIIPSQFPAPRLSRLTQMYGDSSPMGLLWTFMGYAKAYNIFVGLAEATSGLLLFFRRTTTLGALLGVAVVANVVALNFCYDVPVKLYSLHLLFMAVCVAAADRHRLLNVLVLNRSAPPADIFPLTLPRRWLRVGRLVVKFVVVAYALFTPTWTSLVQLKILAKLPSQTPLYGIWDVEEFTRNAQIQAPLATDTNRFKRMIFPMPNRTYVQFMDDQTRRWPTEYGSTNHFSAVTRDDPKHKDVFTYARDQDQLTLTTQLGDDSITIKLRRFDESKFLLLARGFHWINEAPFNR